MIKRQIVIALEYYCKYDSISNNIMNAISISSTTIRWEILSNRIPWEGVADFQLSRLVIDKRKRPSPMPLINIPNNDNNNPSTNSDPISQQINDLIELCWSHDPKDRPSMEEVSQQLENILNEIEKQRQLQHKEKPPSIELLLLMRMAYKLDKVDLNVEQLNQNL